MSVSFCGQLLGIIKIVAMANFWKFVACWFLFQLVFLSALGNAKDAALGPMTHEDSMWQAMKDCQDATPLEGFIVGALFPIAYTPFVEGDWCWNARI